MRRATTLTLTHALLSRDGAVAYGAGWEEFLQLLKFWLSQARGRVDAPYDRNALEHALRDHWEALVPRMNS